MTSHPTRHTKPAHRTGPAIASGITVPLLQIPGAYLLLLALMTQSEGPWDTTVTMTVRAEATESILFDALPLAAVLVAGRKGWLPHHRWWLLLPVVCIVVAVARIIFAPHP